MRMNVSRPFVILSCVFCTVALAAAFDETPLALGASDLAPNVHLDEFKSTATPTMNLETAFEIEAVKQLDLEYETEAPSELELLKQENALLKERVSDLERRLAAVEVKLAE